jgi:succinate dehydrogenase/fumarate reductase flavoprotein subunit
MWEKVGIIRVKKELVEAEKKIRKMVERLNIIKIAGVNKEIIELDNMLLVANIIIISALRRKESRGTHFIEDFPERYDNIWQKHLTIDKSHDKLKR